ncbi:MAG: hypothetical protein OXF73_02450, partial [Gammaproteobacteria bacterium]|nr:hypothetical protein [Gammaproteobacteria bacterium]
RVMIRVAKTGRSSIINWKGGVDSHAPQFQRAVLKGEVQPRSGITPYVAYGDVSVLVLVGTMLVIFILREFVILKQKLRQKERDA